MIIDAILNNNAVVVRRDKRDIIVVERGIGFQLHTKFNSYLLIELADHIHFAVTRLHEQLILHNKLLWEIQIAYEPAFRMGEWALTEIANQIGEQLPEDEAGFIALKFVSNDLSQQHPVNSVAFTQMRQSINAWSFI